MSKNNHLSYRLAREEDFDDFYLIKCDPKNIAWGGFVKAPDHDSFFEWYKRQLSSGSRFIYLVYQGEKCCAFFYIDQLEDGSWEATSSGVLSEFMNQGIGTYALQGQVSEIIRMGGGNSSISSWVSDQNIASYRRYEKLGFTLTDEYELRNIPLLGGEHKFFKWIK